MSSIVARTTLVLLLLFANNAWSQETEHTPGIVTDRPDVTESSIVVPKGSLQFENGITWTTDHGNQSVDFSETLVRFGISTRSELRLVIPNYLYDVTGSNASGFDDIAAGVKQQLGPLWRHFDLAVIAALSLPTGADRISSHGLDPFVKFPWSRDLANGWSLGGMQSFFWNTKAGRRTLVWEPTAMVEKRSPALLTYSPNTLETSHSKAVQSRSPTLAQHTGSLQSSRSIFTLASGSPRRRPSTFLRLATPSG